MPSKRASNATTLPEAGSPAWNAALIAGAVLAALWFSVAAGRVSWPPREILAGIQTLAGCLAVVGPLVLLRRSKGESGLGELAWLTGGLLVWLIAGVGVLSGQWNWRSWATPLPPPTMAIVILAVLLAGWRVLGVGRTWVWTNLTGWMLAAFWITQGVIEFFGKR
jgi:hypothetical protein